LCHRIIEALELLLTVQIACNYDTKPLFKDKSNLEELLLVDFLMDGVLNEDFCEFIELFLWQYQKEIPAKYFLPADFLQVFKAR